MKKLDMFKSKNCTIIVAKLNGKTKEKTAGTRDKRGKRGKAVRQYFHFSSSSNTWCMKLTARVYSSKITNSYNHGKTQITNQKWIFNNIILTGMTNFC